MCINVYAGERRIKRFATLSHIETPILGRLKKTVGVHDCLTILHPTPALGGSPRKLALQWLRDHERLDRGAYAAPWGWISPNAHSHFFIAIRMALISQERQIATLFAGAGIVPESSTEKEWNEIDLKMNFMRGIIG